jgi:hypothetical protein
MEDTGTQPELVHVLRHTFKPSEALRHSLQNFLTNENAIHRLSIMTLSGIALNGFEVGQYRHDEAILRARQLFERHRQPLQLDAHSGAKRMASGALNIYFAVEDRTSLQALKAETYRKFPDNTVFDDTFDPRFDLFVRIDRKDAVSQGEVNVAGRALINQLRSEKRSLYQVAPEELIGRTESHRAYPSPEEQAS